MTRGKLIVLSGPPGSGKTTYARQEQEAMRGIVSWGPVMTRERTLRWIRTNLLQGNDVIIDWEPGAGFPVQDFDEFEVVSLSFPRETPDQHGVGFWQRDRELKTNADIRAAVEQGKMVSISPNPDSPVTQFSPHAVQEDAVRAFNDAKIKMSHQFMQALNREHTVLNKLDRIYRLAVDDCKDEAFIVSIKQIIEGE